MSEIINIGSVSSPIAPAYPTTGQSVVREAGQIEASYRTDSVEISRLGRTMSRITTDSSMRFARINAIRAQIAEGTFETPERISGTVDRLLDVVG